MNTVTNFDNITELGIYSFGGYKGIDLPIGIYGILCVFADGVYEIGYCTQLIFYKNNNNDSLITCSRFTYDRGKSWTGWVKL